MTYKKRKKLNAFGMSSPVRHVRLYHWMLNSPAWQALSLGARSLLIEVWARHNGQNNGEISFSVREAAIKLRVSKDTAAKWFHELVAKGFLKVRRQGSFRWKGGKATTWEVTAERCDERAASKDFMRWKPTAKIQNAVLLRGTSGPTERDHGANSDPEKVPYGPTERDQYATLGPGTGPTERDTYSLPRRGGYGGAR